MILNNFILKNKGKEWGEHAWWIPFIRHRQV